MRPPLPTLVAAPDRTPALTSVIVPVRNGRGVLELQLDAMTAIDYAQPWELVVVDNGSTDDTIELANSYHDRLPIRVVPTSPPGPNGARNAGAAAAFGDYLVFTDADDMVTPEWLSRMVAAAPTAHLVGGVLDRRVVAPDGSWLPHGEGGGHVTSAVFQGDFLPYVVSCNLAVWRDVYDAVGGFDEAARYGGDEVSFSWRVQQAGYVLGRSDAVLLRRERDDRRGVMRQSWHYGLGEARLARDFADAGYPAHAGWRASRRIARRVVLDAPLLVWRASGRRELARRLAFHGGILAGSVRRSGG